MVLRFGDYELEVSYEHNGVSDNGGIFLRFPNPGEDRSVANEGYQVAILDRVDDVSTRTGSVLGYATAQKLNAKPVGEGYNKFRIRFVGTRIEVYLNEDVQANADPVAYYRRFRETQPVGWTEAHEGFFFTTRHADGSPVPESTVDTINTVYDRHTGFALRTMDGFTEAAARHGVRAVTQPCEENAAGAHEAITTLFGRHPDLSALVVHNEAAVSHVLTALTALGRRVPEDVSVVAICPDELAERATPPLTSVLIPAEDVGAQAVGLLMRKIEGSQVPQATLLDPRLTVRASTGASPLGARAAGYAVGRTGCRSTQSWTWSDTKPPS